MVGLAVGVFGTVGLVALAGGILGFKRAGSRASLIAGGISGLTLLGAAVLLAGGAVSLGLALGGVTSVLLAARFAPAFARSMQWMPAGVMTGMSALGIAVAAAGYLSLL